MARANETGPEVLFDITGRDADLMLIELDPHNVYAGDVFPDIDVDTLEDMIDTIYTASIETDDTPEKIHAMSMIMGVTRTIIDTSGDEILATYEEIPESLPERVAVQNPILTTVEDLVALIEKMDETYAKVRSPRAIRVPGSILTAEEVTAMDPPVTLEEDAQFETEMEAIREAERQAYEDGGIIIS